jgi:hypothetical protein
MIASPGLGDDGTQLLVVAAGSSDRARRQGDEFPAGKLPIITTGWTSSCITGLPKPRFLLPTEILASCHPAQIVALAARSRRRK